MEYKGFLARFGYDEELSIFYGEAVSQGDAISFQTGDHTAVTQAFRDAVDSCLAFRMRLALQRDTRAGA